MAKLDLMRRELGDIRTLLIQARAQLATDKDTARVHLDAALKRLDALGPYLGTDPNRTAFQVIQDATSEDED